MRKFLYAIVICCLTVSCQIADGDGYVVDSITICRYSEIKFAESVLLPLEVLELCLDFDEYLESTADEQKNDKGFYGKAEFLDEHTYSISGSYDGKLNMTVYTGGYSIREKDVEWEIRSVSLQTGAYNPQFISTNYVVFKNGCAVKRIDDDVWMLSVPDRFETVIAMQSYQENLYGWKVVVDGKEGSSVGVKSEIMTGEAGLMVHENWSVTDKTKTNVYDGQFFVNIYDGDEPMDYCSMTFRPGFTTIYRASR